MTDSTPLTCLMPRGGRIQLHAEATAIDVAPGTRVAIDAAGTLHLDGAAVRHLDAGARGGVTIRGDVSFDVVIAGDVQDLSVRGDVDCEDVHGTLDAGGDVDCEDIRGPVHAGGDVDCDDVDGPITAGGDVSHG